MSNNHFTHLHLHTEYSLLDGAIRIPDLISFAQKEQWKAVGISDHGNIFGAVKFFQECKKAGIKPILGCEMYLTTDVKIKDAQEKYFHLLVIVQNEIGYKNLCRLMAFSYKEGFYFKPRIDYEILKKYSEGLIVTTSCLGGHIPTLLRNGKEEEAIERASWFLNVFGSDRFFVEVQPPEYEKQRNVNEQLFAFAEKLNLQCVATSDSHFLHKDDHEAHEVMLSIQTHALFSDPDRYSFGEFRGHLRTTSDMLAAFPGREEVVWNSGKIADRCDFAFTFGQLFFPTYQVPQEHTQDSYFKHICKEGLESLKSKNLIPSEQFSLYDERLEIEIDLIIKMGFVGYFLVVGDFIQWAKQNKIPVGPGRGSVAGSLIAWALGITNVDPLKYNLLFERFLNPERISMPDIDIDFCIERREEVINYVRNKYGHDCVCQIITFGSMMAKGVIKDVARTLGFPFKDANSLTDLIPHQARTIKEAIEQEPRLKEMITSNPSVKKLIDLCVKLEGLTRHASKHAAGVVISPKPLDEMLPLYIPPKTTELVAQYAMTELEAVGFLKMDFLGLKNLTLIERCLRAIEKNHNVVIDLDSLPLNDSKTLALLCRGETDGIFQFESDGIKEVLRKLQPDKFEDLIAVNALYRPGPLGSGMVDDFIERRHGRKKTTYMFQELEPILGETYGVIVYQEQVMKIAATIAGYSLGTSDILRRAMGKKKAEVMEQQKTLFVKGATALNFDQKKAAELFDLMAYFAGYGFNKSHSTAYALIAYHTAYLKANYPAEFMAALVSFETNNPDKLTYYLQEIQDMGIITIPPDINQSDIEFAATQKGSIVFGLQGIKNVGLAALQEIIKVRSEKPFVDVLDFCSRIDLRVVNKRIIENLIGSGAFDQMPGNRAQKTNELEKIIALAHERKESLLTGQLSLFGSEKPTEELPLYNFAPCDDWPEKEKLEKERELAGFYLSSHPLKTYGNLSRWFSFPSFSKLLNSVTSSQSLNDIPAQGFGLKSSHRIITTKKGDRMAFVALEDIGGNCEVIVFPKLFKQVESYLDSHSVFIVKGMLDATSNTKCKIKADLLMPLELFFENASLSHIELTLPPLIDEPLVEKIKQEIKPGKIPLLLRFNENGMLLQLRAKNTISCTLEQLKTYEALGIQIQCAL